MIVITGATGFLGSHLLPHLLATDEPVTALVRDDPRLALRRLARALAATPAGHEVLDALPSLVRLVRVDLSAPRLGLPGPVHHELAERTRQIWHCAALTAMTAEPSLLHHVNGEGTRRVLELADAAPRARLLHVSTAYVCGARQGLVHEDDLDDTAGFLNPYEASKHRAERLVRRWARSRGRAVTVFRPSVLVTDRPRPPRTPRHPLSVLGRGLRLLAEELEAADRAATVRLPGSPGSTANLVPVEYAARAMATIGAAPALATVPDGPVSTYHVVHLHDTPVPRVLEAMSHACPGLSIRLEPGRRNAGALDRKFAEATAGFHRYAACAVRFDRGRLGAATRGLSPPAPITPAYLRDALRA